MMEANPSDDLFEQNRDLRQRLDDAEETLRALRHSEVDALITVGPDGDRVYTLKGADEAYRIMVQTMTEGALTIGLDGMILFSNEQFAGMVDTALERVIGSSIKDFVVGEDMAAVSAILGGSGGSKTEIRLRTGPSGRRPAQISGSRLLLDGVDCCCLVVADLSQLRESEKRYRMLVESVKDYAILMLDPQGIVVSWTPAAEKIKGYRADEILGRSFECFYPTYEIQRGRPQELLRAARLKGQFEEDGWRVRKDGTLFWANVTITAVYDERGEFRGFSKVTRDMSERRRMQEALLASEEKFRGLLDSAPDAIVILNENGRVALVNNQAERMFGYTRNELLGRPMETLIPHAGKLHADQSTSGRFRPPQFRKTGAEKELSGLRKDGEEFPVEISLSRINTFEGWVAAGIRDITERIRVEAHLIEARRRAEVANRAKSDFLATMSHEIRTPMNAIMGMADLLWETDLDQTQKDYVGRFRRAGATLLVLLNDILDLSKIESTRFHLESLNFSLSEVLGKTVELLSPRAAAKGIEFTAETLPGTPDGLVGDPGRLQQVLINIVGNAIKFTDAGTVALTVKNHDDGVPGHVHFSVRDTGIGIPPEKMAEIFEDFTQAESSKTRRHGGTGLGLGICRRLVGKMGGGLIAESVEGEGSTFTFNAAFAVSDRATQATNREMADSAGHRVLIVDDDPTNRLIFSRMCAGWGMIPAEAADAGTACELLRQSSESGRRFSLVLIDDVLPDCGGLDLLERIKAFDSALPVILISSDNQSGAMTKADALGAVAYVSKPIRGPELLALVSAAIQKKRGHTELAASPPGQPAGGGRSGRRANRILVADDSEDNRFVVSAYLKNEPYELTFVENGRKALEALAGGEFDLVLMDIQMPVMDGLEATISIRAMERQRSAGAVPVVAVTAGARPEDFEASKSAGCNGHLSKPISKETLIAAIEKFRRRPIEIPEGLEELSRNYVGARQREIAGMARLVNSRDFDELRVFGHNMKGTGASFGFPELSTLGAAIEEAAKESRRSELADQLSRVSQFLEYAWQAFPRA